MGNGVDEHYIVDHFNAVAEAILSAKSEIYIADWWLTPELVREQIERETLANMSFLVLAASPREEPRVPHRSSFGTQGERGHYDLYYYI